MIKNLSANHAKHMFDAWTLFQAVEGFLSKKNSTRSLYMHG